MLSDDLDDAARSIDRIIDDIIATWNRTHLVDIEALRKLRGLQNLLRDHACRARQMENLSKHPLVATVHQKVGSS